MSSVEIRAPVLNPDLNPYTGWDVRTLLELQAKANSEKKCLIWEPLEGDGRTWSYREFVEEVAKVGAGLAQRGIARGDKVVVHLENCPEQLMAWFGCAWIGAIAVTTNAKSSRAELQYFSEVARARAAITQPKYFEVISAAMPNADWIAVTETDSGSAPAIPPAPNETFRALLADPNLAPAGANDCGAPFGVQFTSGTTSRPKGVVWTHANALFGGHVSAMHEALRSDDIHLVYLPLFHTNAQIYSVMASLWVGATLVLQPRFSASQFWPVALKHRCTWTSMVPFVTYALVEQPVPEQHDFRMWGNAVCDINLDPHFKVRTLGWWGMTETVTHGIVGSPFHADLPLSMGRPAPEYGIRVVRDDGAAVERGETGNLIVRGVRGLSLFSEYLENPEATAAAYNDEGWMITGDRVTLSECGWLKFADRSKDMMKVGGENVSASEVERVISTVPGVREVAVVARPDKMLQEVPVAFVCPLRFDESENKHLAEQCMAVCQTELASFKVPKDVVVLEDFPRATLNKVAKAELRKLFLADTSGVN